MPISEKNFLLGCGMVLAAAVLFAAIIIWHDERMPAQSATMPPRSSAQTPPPLQPGQPNPVDSLPHHPAYTLDGSISSVAPGSFLLKSVNATGAITILVDSHTNIFSYGAKKSDAEFQNEMSTFLAAMQYATSSSVQYDAPSQYQTVLLKLPDLKAGMFVVVGTNDDSSRTTLHAVEIFVPPQQG